MSQSFSKDQIEVHVNWLIEYQYKIKYKNGDSTDIYNFTYHYNINYKDTWNKEGMKLAFSDEFKINDITYFHFLLRISDLKLNMNFDNILLSEHRLDAEPLKRFKDDYSSSFIYGSELL